jgi:DNA primase
VIRLVTWTPARTHGSPTTQPTTTTGDLNTSVGVAAEIKQKLDLVELVGESVQLRKSGASFKGLCPFHGEKTPSFIVTPARETWKCFGCGRGGDLFTFVMERDGIDFPEALRRLAGRAGVEISERTTREDARRKRLRDVLESAVAFYHRVLTQSRHGQAALDYLRSRGFTDATLESQLIGYAPDAWDTLTRALVERRDVRDEELVQAGLAAPRQGGRGVYDRFRGRIIFPIRDASGNATGLGGRVVGATSDGPKYLNSPATLLFDKSRTLYLIDRAKAAVRRTGVAVLVEGNTDALMAHQQGFENVVGSLGTALTAAQVELVTRYAPRIAMAYDVDAAGEGAATFGATELTALVGEIERSPYRGRLTDVDVVRLPDGRDPDEVMRDDPDTWRTATEQPQPIMEYLIETHAKRHDPHTASGRERLVAAVMPTLRSISDPTRRDYYLQVLARRSGVEERVLLQTLRRREQPSGIRSIRSTADHAGRRIDLDAVMSTPDALDPEAVARAIEPVESTLLRLVLMHPELRTAVRERLEPTDLITTPARELWRALAATGSPFARDRFLESLDPTLQAVARTLYARSDPLPPNQAAIDRAVEQCLLRLEKRRLDERFDFERAELAEAEANGDQSARDRIARDIRSLESQRSDLDRRIAGATLLSRTRTASHRTPTPAGGPA